MQNMLKQAVKVAAVTVGSVVAFGYSVAFVLNLLHGFPTNKQKLKRAFHPAKVLKLNYAVFQQLKYLKIVPYIARWKYLMGDKSRFIQDISYGNNECLLDLYLPKNHDVNRDNKPIVMFVYGGAWGSGDKSYYGVVCSQLADQLEAIVCCPNYSIYPRGYVDDQIQDVVDCLSWLQNNAALYGGDKTKVMMIGHSAGGHLCMMAMLELIVKRYQQDPSILEESSSGSTLAFEEKHFNGNGTQMEGSYCVVNDTDSNDMSNGTKAEEGNGNNSLSASYQMLDKENGDKESDKEETEHGDSEDKEVAEFMDTTDPSLAVEESVVVEKVELTDAQRQLKDLCNSIKVCIGLCGVYHIADHYEQEYKRGIEDISTMAKAMYGPEHFDRFSPTVIVENVPSSIRLPPIVLIHGANDTTAPPSTTTKFRDALARLHANVTVDIIPDCGHLDTMMDIIDEKRKFHYRIMDVIKQAAQRYL